MPTIRQILIAQLTALGANGLCNPTIECGCDIDDLAPCHCTFDTGIDIDDCKPAKKGDDGLYYAMEEEK